MYYPKYVWILYGWYSDEWLMNNVGITCTYEQMLKVVEKAIVIQTYNPGTQVIKKVHHNRHYYIACMLFKCMDNELRYRNKT